MSKIEHRVYQNGELIRELENAGLYDTLSPYRWVANFFNDLNQMIVIGDKIEIVSNDKKFKITNEKELRKWIVESFNSPYNNGFEKYLTKKLE